MSKDILLKNGNIVTHNRTFRGDILVSGEKIKTVGKDIVTPDFNGEIIDSERFLIFPGGVDPHVHMELPVGDKISSDNFESGSIAAISGGTTSIIDFVTPSRSENLLQSLKARKEQAKGSFCDYGLHLSIVSLHNGVEEQIREAVDKEGIFSFKIYMAYKDSVGMDDKDILKSMDLINSAGGMVMIHCEDGDAVSFLENKFCNDGKEGIEYYPDVRNDEIESDAVGRAILFSKITGCPLYVVHISSEKSLKKLYSGKEAGAKILGETCPHYLILNNSVYSDPDRGKKYLMCPPLRNESGPISLWNALYEGLIDVISTDHCPFMGKGDRSDYPDNFSKIPKGVGGVEFRLKLLYTYGVLPGKISVNRFVNLVSTRPAKIFGLYPRKGAICPGADADLVIWDPEKSEKISVKSQYQNCDSNIYDGTDIMGGPETVIKGGKIVFEKGLFDISSQRGRYIKRYR